jgi:hypothetical protein
MSEELTIQRKRHCRYGTGLNYKGVYNHYFLKIKQGSKRDKIKHLPFTITLEQIGELWEQQGGICAITKEPIQQKISKIAKRHEYSASLDRIDSDKGYTIDNVQWIHKDVNKLKKDWNQDKLFELCKKISKWN